MSKATYPLKLPLSIRKGRGVWQRMTESPWTNGSLRQCRKRLEEWKPRQSFSRNAQAIRPATGSWSFFTTHPMLLLNLKT
jgi:hypothetical protein